jgi:hypothetical protein
MKEMIRQYGAAVIAAVVALLLLTMIGKVPLGGTEEFGNQFLQGKALSVQTQEGAMEEYWRSQ